METRRILMRSLAVAVVIASVIWTTTGEEILRFNQFFCLTVAAVSTAKVTDPIIDIRLQHESLPCVYESLLFLRCRHDDKLKQCLEFQKSLTVWSS
uniref:Uncharacterized protein n=1 Tax=Sinocyclocheilus grahami TaxID=75366 RepID=A0A672RLJ3_SINGR